MSRSTDPRVVGTLQRLRMLASDTVVYGAASAVNKSFALILFPLLARTLSVEDYGRLDFALYAAVLFALIFMWGQDSAVARLFFEDEDESDRKQIVSQAFLVMGGNLVVAFLAIAAFTQSPLPARTFGSHIGPMLALIAIHAPLSGLLSFCQSVLKWTFDRRRYLIVALGLPAVNVVVMLLSSRSDRFGPVMALSVMVGVGAAFAFLSIFMIRRWLVRPSGMAYIRKLVPLALPYGAIVSIGWVVPLVERAVVSTGFGETDLGLYAAAAKIASLAAMVTMAFQMAWGPLSYSIYKQPDSARTYNLVLRSFSALICVTVLVLSALADPVILLLAGGRFAGASIFVFPIAMAFAIQAIGWVTELGIHLSKRSYLNLIGFGVFFTVSMVGIIYFPRAIGLIGVPLGGLLGQLAMFVTSARIAQRAYPIPWNYGLPAANVTVTLAFGLVAVIAPQIADGARSWWFYAMGAGVLLVLNLVFGLDARDRNKLAKLIQTMNKRKGTIEMT